MIGIYGDLIDSIVSRNNSGIEDFKSSSKKITDNFDELDDCYSGQIFRFVSDDLYENKTDIKKIKDILSNYSKTLQNVKKSYVMQDQIFSEQLSNVASNYR